MTLKFFGRGSGFSDDHTSAYFSTGNNELVILDCPVSTFQKLKHMDLSDYDTFYVLITHTHGDHVGGLGLLVQYAYFVLKKSVIIVAPSIDVASDIQKLLALEGNENFWYLITTTYAFKRKWFGSSILTEHSPKLHQKCFGYYLIVNGTNIVYTGDTSTLEPFLPYLETGSELYVDTSVHYGAVHLKLEDALKNYMVLAKEGIKVYLMHLDDVAVAEKIIADIPGIEVVTVD